MKYRVVEKSFTDSNGKVVKFNQCILAKTVNDIYCEIIVTPKSDERILKTMLVNNYLQAEVVNKITNFNNEVYEKLVVKIGNDEIPLKAGKSDILLFKLMEKATTK